MGERKEGGRCRLFGGRNARDSLLRRATSTTPIQNHTKKHTNEQVKGIRVWSTNEYKHSGIRDDGARIFDRLLSMARDVLPVE